LREILKHVRRVLAGHDPEDHDLVFDAERGEQGGDVGRMAIAKHVAQACVVARAQDRRQLFRRTRFFPYRRDDGFAAGTGELVFHLLQRCSDDVVVMHMRTDGFDRVEPQAVNQVEVAGGERRWMRAEVVGIGAAAAVVDDEPDIEGFGLVGAFPGFTENPRLIGR
jgi:hypothetical protein